MKRMLVITVLVAAASGCGADTAKQEAFQRWGQARSHVLCGVGVEQHKVGDLDKAQSYAQQALSLDKDYVPARVLLAKVLLEKGLYAQALEELRQAEAKAPANAELAYLLGVALEKREELADALKSYQKARALDDANTAYVTASAEVLVKLNQPVQALELLEARLARADGSPAMLLLAGELSMLVKEPARAADYFQRCLDLEPENLPLRENLAKALFFAGKHADALVWLNKLAGQPAYQDKVSWVYIMMGDALLATGRAAEARSAYETARRLEPDDGQVCLALAKAALSLRDPQRAILASRQALALLNEDEVGAKASGFRLQASGTTTTTNPEARGPRSEAAVAPWGPQAEATLVLGYALLVGGQVADAIAVLSPAARKHADQPALWCALGRAYWAQGQKDQARTCYRNALEHKPDDRLAKSLLAWTEAAAAPEPGMR